MPAEEEPLIQRRGSAVVSKSGGFRKTSVIDGGGKSPREETKLLSFSKDLTSSAGYESIQGMVSTSESESAGLLFHLTSKEPLKRKSVGSLRREFFAEMSPEKSSSSLASVRTEDSIAKRDAAGRVQVVKVSDEGIELKGMIGPIQEESGIEGTGQQAKSTASTKRSALLRMSGKFKRDKLRDSLKLRPGLSVTAPPEDNIMADSSSTGTVEQDLSQRSSMTRRSRRRRDSTPVTAASGASHSISVSPSTSSQHLLGKNNPSTSGAQSSSSLPRTPSKRRHSTAPSLHPPPPPRSASRSPSRFGETGL